MHILNVYINTAILTAGNSAIFAVAGMSFANELAWKQNSNTNNRNASSTDSLVGFRTMRDIMLHNWLRHLPLQNIQLDTFINRRFTRCMSLTGWFTIRVQVFRYLHYLLKPSRRSACKLYPTATPPYPLTPPLCRHAAVERHVTRRKSNQIHRRWQWDY